LATKNRKLASASMPLGPTDVVGGTNNDLHHHFWRCPCPWPRRSEQNNRMRVLVGGVMVSESHVSDFKITLPYMLFNTCRLSSTWRKHHQDGIAMSLFLLVVVTANWTYFLKSMANCYFLRHVDVITSTLNSFAIIMSVYLECSVLIYLPSPLPNAIWTAQQWGWQRTHHDNYNLPFVQWHAAMRIYHNRNPSHGTAAVVPVAEMVLCRSNHTTQLPLMFLRGIDEDLGATIQAVQITHLPACRQVHMTLQCFSCKIATWYATGKLPCWLTKPTTVVFTCIMCGAAWVSSHNQNCHYLPFVPNQPIVQGDGIGAHNYAFDVVRASHLTIHRPLFCNNEDDSLQWLELYTLSG